MKLLLESWREFLTEENDKLSEMATAWKERGLAGPYKLESGEMGSTLDALKQYVTPDNEKPTHFIHFGGVGHRDTLPDPKLGELDRGPQFKFGINPRSNYNTPTGIYSFPLSDEIYRQLEMGSSDRKSLQGRQRWNITVQNHFVGKYVTRRLRSSESWCIIRREFTRAIIIIRVKSTGPTGSGWDGRKNQ